MTVRELIEVLNKQDPAAEVYGIYDGAARLTVEDVWTAQSGAVVLAEKDEAVYYDEDRPHGAPTQAEVECWTRKP